MKKFIGSIITSIMLFAGALHAQVILPVEILSRGEMPHGTGYSPKSLESLVGTSSIIIKGRFSGFNKNELSYGSGRSREDVMRIFGYSEQEADELGLPVSDYNVIVDEVLLGDPNLKGETILYQIQEQPSGVNKFQDPNVDRLFFLVKNGDGSYTPLGHASVQNDRGGYYTYDAIAAIPDAFYGRTLSFIEDNETAAFTKAVEDEVERIYGR